MEGVDLQTQITAYAMAIGIGSLLSVPFFCLIAFVLAIYRKASFKVYLRAAVLMGIAFGSFAGLKTLNKNISDTAVRKESVKNELIERKTFLRRRMSEIIEQVKADPEKSGTELKPEFYRLVKEYVGDDYIHLKALKFNMATANKVYKDLVFEDAIESLKKGTAVKSTRRQEVEQAMLKNNPGFQKQIELDESFLELIATKQSMSTETPIIYDADDVRKLSKQSNKMWTAVESLFDP